MVLQAEGGGRGEAVNQPNKNASIVSIKENFARTHDLCEVANYKCKGLQAEFVRKVRSYRNDKEKDDVNINWREYAHEIGNRFTLKVKQGCHKKRHNQECGN